MEPPGQGWASLAVYHQDTRDAYGPTGDKGQFPGNGHAVATQAFLTVALGWATGLDTWGQFSFQRLEFDDFTGARTSTGLGDMRFYVRFNPFLRRGSSFPIALRGGLKVAAGDFDVGSSMIPLGDGQRDWELLLELGHSFYPAPFYVMGWAGYKWREEKDPRTDFGDERLFYVAMGGTLRVVDFKVALDGWYGATPTFNAVRADGAEREMLRVSPSLLVSFGPGQLELGGRVPLAGRNLPAGADVVVGYFARLGSPGG